MSDSTIKKTLQRLPYGFYSITSKSGEDVNAMVANWITQASFSPRLVAFGLQKTSHTHQLVEQGKVFVVNIFNKEDVEFLKPFTKSRAKNPQKMENATYSAAPITGCPVLDGAAAFLECSVIAMHDDGGDHDIVVAEVVGAGEIKPGDVTNALTLPDLGWSYAG